MLEVVHGREAVRQAPGVRQDYGAERATGQFVPQNQNRFCPGVPKRYRERPDRMVLRPKSTATVVDLAVDAIGVVHQPASFAELLVRAQRPDVAYRAHQSGLPTPNSPVSRIFNASAVVSPSAVLLPVRLVVHGRAGHGSRLLGEQPLLSRPHSRVGAAGGEKRSMVSEHPDATDEVHRPDAGADRRSRGERPVAARAADGGEGAHGAAQPEGGAGTGHRVRQRGGQPAEGSVTQVSYGPGTLVPARAQNRDAFRTLSLCDTEKPWNDRVMLEQVHQGILRAIGGSCGA
ncbi:hypothetical protein GCM10010279_32210 [Streptomyces mutabilis]|nr:hypothetical protein GCM10010279_32210 [Streptomyces mutabilis]